MKKALIAGAASVALAAMPVVGVFAADPTSTSFTDTLTVGVAGGCTIEQSDASAEAGTYTNREFTQNIAVGNVGYLNAADATTPPTTGGVTVSCNTDASTTSYTVSVAVDGLTDSNVTPAAKQTIAGGMATSGDNSAWAIQSNATGFESTSTNNPFATYKTAATGTFLTATAADEVTFNPSYRVYVAPEQPQGTYVGHAVYSINLNS
jgi:hypothetical protein